MSNPDKNTIPAQTAGSQADNPALLLADESLEQLAGGTESPGPTTHEYVGSVFYAYEIEKMNTANAEKRQFVEEKFVLLLTAIDAMTPKQ